MADELRQNSGAPGHSRAPRGEGLADVKYLLRLPKDIAEAARRKAKEQGITLNEWWRKTAREALGLKG